VVTDPATTTAKADPERVATTVKVTVVRVVSAEADLQTVKVDSDLPTVKVDSALPTVRVDSDLQVDTDQLAVKVSDPSVVRVVALPPVKVSEAISLRASTLLSTAGSSMRSTISLPATSTKSQTLRLVASISSVGSRGNSANTTSTTRRARRTRRRTRRRMTNLLRPAALMMNSTTFSPAKSTSMSSIKHI